MLSRTNEWAVRLVQRVLASQLRQRPGRAPVRVSPLAADVLGIQRAPWWVSPGWTVASAGLSILIVLACAFTVAPLAAG